MNALSVVIPSRNGRELLKNYLPAILRETADCNGELILVDDCSTDGTIEYLRVEHPSVKVIERTDKPAFCRAVNLGMKRASGSFLLLLNNDTIPGMGSFKALLQRLRSADELTAVALPSIPRPDGTDDSLFRVGVERGLAVTGQLVSGYPYPSGACALWRREAWEALEGLDHRYAPIYWEDADMGVRMLKKGYSMLLCPEITVDHIHASTMGTSAETMALRERNRFIFMDAHGMNPGLWLPIHLFSAVLKRNRPFLRGYSAYRRWRKNR